MRNFLKVTSTLDFVSAMSPGVYHRTCHIFAAHKHFITRMEKGTNGGWMRSRVEERDKEFP